MGENDRTRKNMKTTATGIKTWQGSAARDPVCAWSKNRYDRFERKQARSTNVKTSVSLSGVLCVYLIICDSKLCVHQAANQAQHLSTKNCILHTERTILCKKLIQSKENTINYLIWAMIVIKRQEDDTTTCEVTGPLADTKHVSAIQMVIRVPFTQGTRQSEQLFQILD